AAGLEMLPASYYEGLSDLYLAKRELFYPALLEAGFRCSTPTGAYYILSDFSDLSDLPDDEFSLWLTREVGVTPVPGSSFFSDPADGRRLVRWAFCKTEELLEQAVERLLKIRSLV
ncbi:MAG: aminotransferase class I/II-fold pyridoxal phosphate-dependent enzyme, partial [Gemmatimonadota bacterium]|nr:aminotransferase class I/II-fold pyridoxal phosphate-dependent enzyme [Gemmatimonadota bacterium]